MGNQPKTPLSDRTDNKKLIAALEKAEQKIQRLTERDRQHRLFQQELEKRTYELKERVKELNCLYTISAIIETKGATLEEILQRTVDIIPDAWQYPDITTSRIILNDRAFTSRNFEKTKWRQSQNIVVQGRVCRFT